MSITSLVDATIRRYSLNDRDLKYYEWSEETWNKTIYHLILTLIYKLKNMVDEWVSAFAALARYLPDSINQEGLPSPPLDETTFLATQPTTLELSLFFNRMTDNDEKYQCIDDLRNIDSTLKAPLPEDPHLVSNHRMQLKDDTHNGIKQNQFLGEMIINLRNSSIP